jgi:CubicO group peptidase (beta-lactamase class C family)
MPRTVHCLRLPLAPLAIATAACAGSRAAPRTDARLHTADSLVASWVDTGRIPGAVLLVSQNDSTVLEQAYGWAELSGYGRGQYGDWPRGPGADAAGADSTVHPGIQRLAHPVSMTTATVFDMASVTKVMATTFAVMMLVDEGKLELDAPLRRYLPDFRGPEKDRITLRMLLTHRAGLYQWQPIYYHASNEREAYAYIRDLPLNWKPGEGRHYSDLGFMLLGLVVERVSSQPLDTFMHDRLYGPLGLEHTGFRRVGAGAGAGAGADGGGRPFAATSLGNPFEFRMVHDSTFGYRYAGDPAAWNGWRRRALLGEVNDGNAFQAFNGVAGHAGLFSSARDLDVLLRVLLHKGEYRGRRYVRAATVDTFMTPTGDGQALGWQVPSYAPAGSFDHTGFTGTYVLGVPARGLAVVLLTNRQNVGVDARTRYPDVDPLRRAVAEALLGSTP